jgi:hypothetical protein
VLEDNFFDPGDRHGWEDRLEDEERMKMFEQNGMLALRGLTSVSIRAPCTADDHWDYATTARQQQVHAHNLQNLEPLLLKSVVRQPKPVRPLYMGSEVCFGTSEGVDFAVDPLKDQKARAGKTLMGRILWDLCILLIGISIGLGASFAVK